MSKAEKMELGNYLQERGSLTYLLRHLNRSIEKIGRRQFFMTFSAALVDTQANELVFASAGHEAPLLIPADPKKSISALHTGPSERLGEAPDADFSESRCSFLPGDTVAWYTDGLVDIFNSNRRSFGDGRLLRSLRSIVADRSIASPRAFWTTCWASRKASHRRMTSRWFSLGARRPGTFSRDEAMKPSRSRPITPLQYCQYRLAAAGASPRWSVWLP